ncbi:MAG: T9SS type A sorting domain-containing protein [Taibaiella sp.]|jgi:hypothetical protein
MTFFRKLLFLLFAGISFPAHAQEYILPLQENVIVNTRSKIKGQTSQKPTVLSLPFFEDFTDNDPYPNSERWADRYVYINNTMGRNPISRGVATFDALNEKGDVYYDTIASYTLIYADSLTSQAIDLSTNQPSDSVYLSFFYQRKGYGFSPKPADSLMLYLLKSNGEWTKVWSLQGDTAQAPFTQVMVRVSDTDYFNNNFQMRWINKATKGISDSHWNLDYIRLDAGRSQSDSLVRDIAFTKDPESILNDFTAMPFRHFKTNPGSFLAANLSAYLRNNGPASPNIPAGYTAKVLTVGTNLGSGTINTALSPYTENNVLFPMYNAGSFNPANINDKVVYENKFYCNSNYPNESKTNDTIIYNQVFDHYFAYDDGTAEQAYFLNLQPNAPGATAVEYALYAPDTVKGIAIRFARTLPPSDQKEFAIRVYRDIAVNGGSDVLLYQEDFLYPNIEDTINKFSVYAFQQPVAMNAGTFFISIVQPAGGTSDSLQIALDANRTGGNHRYFKVLNNWEPSLLDGALLLRPIVGSGFQLGIHDQNLPEVKWSIHPNPATDKVTVHLAEINKKTAQYNIVDIQGKLILSGKTADNKDVDIQSLSPGIYFIKLYTESGFTRPLKLLKL